MLFKTGLIINHRYELIHQIGEGGFAQVFQAFDRTLNREVVLKVLKNISLSGQDDLERFQREARILGQLVHPGIISIYSFEIVEESIPIIVMEYFEGVPLLRLLQNGPLNSDGATRLFLQVTDALTYLHKADVVHRDLSPANILVLPDNLQAKIIDFGLSRLFAKGEKTLTATGLLLGNPSYMSPEQCWGKKVDCRSDIYALGCIIYETVTGKTAFAADSPIAILYKQQNEFPDEPPLDGWNEENAESFKTIILRCLQKDPDKRFQTAEELGTALGCDYSARQTFAADAEFDYWGGKRKVGHRVQNHLIAPVLLCLGLLLALCFTCVMRQANNRFPPRQPTPFELQEGNLKKGVDAEQKIFGQFSLPVIKKTEKLASFYVQNGKVSEAIELYKQIIEVRTQRLNDLASLDLSKDYDDMSHCLFSKSKYREAEQAASKAIEIRSTRLTAPNADIADSMELCANALQRMNKLDRAEKYYKDSLRMREQLYGPMFSWLQQPCYRLGEICETEKRYAEGEAYFLRAISISRGEVETRKIKNSSINGQFQVLTGTKSLPLEDLTVPEFEESAAISKALGRMYEEWGKPAKAVAVYEELAARYAHRHDKANAEIWKAKARELIEQSAQDR